MGCFIVDQSSSCVTSSTWSKSKFPPVVLSTVVRCSRLLVRVLFALDYQQNGSVQRRRRHRRCCRRRTGAGDGFVRPGRKRPRKLLLFPGKKKLPSPTRPCSHHIQPSPLPSFSHAVLNVLLSKTITAISSSSGHR